MDISSLNAHGPSGVVRWLGLRGSQYLAPPGTWLQCYMASAPALALAQALLMRQSLPDSCPPLLRPSRAVHWMSSDWWSGAQSELSEVAESFSLILAACQLCGLPQCPSFINEEAEAQRLSTFLKPPWLVACHAVIAHRSPHALAVAPSLCMLPLSFVLPLLSSSLDTCPSVLRTRCGEHCYSPLTALLPVLRTPCSG